MTNSVSGPSSGSSRGPGVRTSASRCASALLDRADVLRSQSVGAGAPADRFHSCYLAALRGAGAVLAAVEGPAAGRGRTRSRNAWVLMADAAPEFGEWAEYFAGYSATRAAVEAGRSRTLGDLEADEFFVEVGRFLQAVEDRIGRGEGLDLRAS